MHFVDWAALVVVLVAIRLVSGDAPSYAVGVDGEFGELVGNYHAFDVVLGGNFVAEGHAVVKNAKTEGKNALGLGGFGKVEGGFGIIIVNFALLAPFRLPSVVGGTAVDTHETDVGVEIAHTEQAEAEHGFTQDEFFVFFDGIAHLPVFERKFGYYAAVGGFDLHVGVGFWPAKEIPEEVAKKSHAFFLVSYCILYHACA